MEKRIKSETFTPIKKIIPETMIELDDLELQKIMDEHNNVNNPEFYRKYHLPEEFIEKNIEKINWLHICYFQKLNEYFLAKHQNKIDWNIISLTQSLSEAFIDQYQDRLTWRLICFAQYLSESFIEKHQDKVDWDNISGCQSMSIDFIKKNIEKINIEQLRFNKKVDHQELKKEGIL